MVRHWTLRRQLTILTVLFLTLSVAALWLVAEVFQSREGAVVARSESKLATADALLIKLFRESDFEPLTMTRLQWNDQLRILATEALAPFARVEGGFYLLHKDQLLGYAYPTHGGTVPKTDIPAAEEGTILQLVRRATSLGLPQQLVLHSGLDILVLRSDPLGFWGAVWTMNRIPKAQDMNQKVLSVLIVLVNLAVGGWTFYIALQLQRGVQQLEQSIKAIEAGSSNRIPPLPAEMGRIGAAINAMHHHRQQLEQRLRRSSRLAALGQLVAGVAHEVRNPLASMRLNLQYTQRQLQQHQISTVPVVSLLEQIDRLEYLVQQLLYFDQNHWQEDFALTSLEALVAETVALLRLQAQEQGVSLVYRDSLTPLPLVPLHRHEIGQVIINMIVNAIQASPQGSQVEIGVKALPDYLVVSIEDRGTGIPPQEQERIFDPFYSTKPDGTGLGLAISHEIVTRHGGHITLDSQRGYTRFSVFLPYDASKLTARLENYGYNPNY